MDGCTQRGLRGLLAFQRPLYMNEFKNMKRYLDVTMGCDVRPMVVEQRLVETGLVDRSKQRRVVYCSTCVDRDYCGRS